MRHEACMAFEIWDEEVNFCSFFLMFVLGLPTLHQINATSISRRWNSQVQCLHHVDSQWWTGCILLLNHLASSVTMLPPTLQNIGKPCAVYAGNLSWSTTEEQLLSFGGGDRGAMCAEIKRHKDTKRSKGWGYGLNHITNLNFLHNLEQTKRLWTIIYYFSLQINPFRIHRISCGGGRSVELRCFERSRCSRKNGQR